MKDYLQHNQGAWDKLVRLHNRWTQPVGPEEIARARKGDWQVLLTPQTPVPREWFPDMRGCNVLCLAGAGGQQAPIFAAAGARVTVMDLSPKQLEQDEYVAEREDLEIETVQGDMADLDGFSGNIFDLVFHPVSNCFIPDVNPVWQGVYRILRPGGSLLAGFCNPIMYLFAEAAPEWRMDLTKVQKIPYADPDTLTQEQLDLYAREGHPLEFGHTLTDQIDGQLRAGFLLTGFYEDAHHDEENPLHGNIDVFIATRAVKPE